MKRIIMSGLAVALILACGISYFASSSPDGLERVAHDKGFLEKSEGKEVFKAPLSDYKLSFVKEDLLSNAAAGLLGTLLVFGLTFALGKLVSKRKKS
ncbi:MAG: PDGLE domain-containing protein [Candidatus Firestonebacteria bacterium]|nr:PDGLE domain-containing protein [Candidatus Firestonebacteria bacterium]